MSDSFGTLAPTPARGMLAALTERIRSIFTKEVEAPAVQPPALAAPEQAFTPWPSPAERIAADVRGLITDQIPWREFGADQMPLDIASAGIVQPYEQTMLQLSEFLADRPGQDADAIIDHLISSNYSHGIVQPGGSANSIERIANDWTLGGVGGLAAERMLDNAMIAMRTGVFPGTDTALVEQPFGVRLVRALEEWESRVLEIDATDLPVAEKALRIEGLGIAPTIGDFVLKDQSGNVYQRGTLDLALQAAERDIEQGLEEPGGQELDDYGYHNIQELARSAWFMPEPNAEYRQSFGQSADGFHHLTEISYGGGDREEGWSDPYPSLAEARDASDKIIDRTFYPERAVEAEHEVGGHDL